MKRTHQTILDIRPEDIDQMGHVNNVVHVRWVQEVAAAHWHALAPAEALEQYRWVVLRHEVDYLKPALPGDELTGITWVDEMEGVKSIRVVEIRKGETVLAKARTTWVMLAADSGRPTRISPELAKQFLG